VWPARAIHERAHHRETCALRFSSKLGRIGAPRKSVRADAWRVFRPSRGLRADLHDKPDGESVAIRAGSALLRATGPEEFLLRLHPDDAVRRSSTPRDKMFIETEIHQTISISGNIVYVRGVYLVGKKSLPSCHPIPCMIPEPVSTGGQTHFQCAFLRSEKLHSNVI